MLEEAQKLRTPQMHAALAWDLNTGLRNKELREIRWEQIDLIHKKELTVGKSKTEAGTGRVIPLNETAIAALDLKTGQRKWHYQLVHHGLWDMDIPCAPILADITIGGRTIKAIAQPTKRLLPIRLIRFSWVFCIWSIGPYEVWCIANPHCQRRSPGAGGQAGCRRRSPQDRAPD